MKASRRTTLRLLVAIAIGTLTLPAAAAQSGTIAVEKAWARATPNGARTGAVYLTLVNRGPSDDKLVGASTPVADEVKFHSTTDDNGIMRMRQVLAIDLKPGAAVTFDPGHLHIMMIGLKQPLKDGGTLPLTLEFEKTGKVEVSVPIQRIGAMHGGGMSGMQH